MKQYKSVELSSFRMSSPPPHQHEAPLLKTF